MSDIAVILRASRAVVATFALLVSPVAAAQIALPPTIDPSTINEAARRDQQRRDAEPPPRETGDVVTSATTPDASGPAGSATIAVRQIVFDPSAYLRAEELTALARPFVGRAIGIAELRTLIDRVNARYAAAGIATARATLPPQRIADGVVRVHLIEGRVGQVTVTQSGSGSGRDAKRVAGAPGSLADPRALEARILRYNRTRDGQLTAALAPGTGAGETDVALTLTEPPRLAIDLFADNNGFGSTGEAQGGYTVRLYRLLGDADRAAIGFLASEGVRSLSASYGATIGDRLRIGASYARGTTHVTGGALADADIRGTSDTGSVDASALLASTARLSVIAAFAGRYTESQVSIAGVTVGRSQITTAEMRGTIGWSMPGVSAQLSHGVQIAADRERLTGATRDVLIHRGGASLGARAAFPLFARVRAEWQATGARDLGGTLQFFASGASGARAFAPGALSGDDGVSASAEIGSEVSVARGALSLFGFVDGARVSQAGALADGYSAGVAVAGSVARVAVRAHLAQPIGGSLPDRRLRGFVSIGVSL